MAILGQERIDKTPWDIDKMSDVCERSQEVSNELLSSSIAHFENSSF